MLSNIRIWIALAVIASGIAAAFVLPKDKTDSVAQERPPVDGLVRRSFDFDEAIAQTRSPQPATLNAPTTSAVETAPPVGPSPLDVLRPTPRLEDAYPERPTVNAHRLSPEVFRELAQRPIGAKLTDVDKRASSPTKPVTHKISDGDTLHTIAQRFLGDADRYREIFEANRDQLSNPEVLPIGTELRIPLGDTHSSEMGAPQVVGLHVSMRVDGALPGEAELSGIDRKTSPMVEIPPGTLRAVPRPEQPRRTYRVREGDTLVSIARRLYGDGRRYRDIFEANRDQLASPNALSVGVLLQLP